MTVFTSIPSFMIESLYNDANNTINGKPKWVLAFLSIFVFKNFKTVYTSTLSFMIRSQNYDANYTINGKPSIKPINAISFASFASNPFSY